MQTVTLCREQTELWQQQQHLAHNSRLVTPEFRISDSSSEVGAVEVPGLVWLDAVWLDASVLIEA